MLDYVDEAAAGMEEFARVMAAGMTRLSERMAITAALLQTDQLPS